MPYNRVSTRLLAEKAGVNAALIRYYFGDKAGLYEAMLRDTLAPMREKMLQASRNPDQTDIQDIIETYYKVMAPSPDLPKLLLRAMMMDENEAPRQITEGVFIDLIHSSQQWLTRSLVENHHLKEGVNPNFARLSFVSLTVFPFLAPPQLLAKLGIDLSTETLSVLAHHNGNVLKQGMLSGGLHKSTGKPEDGESGGNHD